MNFKQSTTLRAATIGVDVSKKTLDTAVLFTNDSYVSQSFSNDAQGIKQLLRWLAKQRAKGCPLCVESTGSLHVELCLAAHHAKHPVRIVKPSRIISFRRSLDDRNKTDCDDARLIALFTNTIKTGDWTPPTPTIQRLLDLLKWRRVLVQSQVALRNTLSTMRDPRQRQFALTDIKTLQQRIDKLDASMAKIIAADIQLSEKQALLCSIPGVGDQTAARCCASIDINDFDDAGQLSSFAGLTPMRRQSGDYEAPTHISKMGNGDIRCALFMAALSASVYNPIIRAFADRLKQRRPNLSRKQIIVACAHKLLRIIYGVLKHNRPFDANYLCPSNALLTTHQPLGELS